MKFARPLLITFGILGGVLVAALAIARIPSIQRWAVLRASAGRPGLKVEVAAISAGFSSLSLRGVSVEQRGLKVKIEHLEMTYSVWSLLFNHRLQVQHLVADGLMVDASRVSRGKARAAVLGGPAVAPGLLGQIRLPVELVLEECELAGSVLLPGASGQPPLEATGQIKGGGFSSGEEGSLRLIATVKNPAADASVGTLHAQVSLRATQNSLHGFSRVNLTAVVDAEGPIFSEMNQLKIVTELTSGAVGESYSLSVDTLIHGVAENLLALRAALPAGQSEYAGQWTLKARNAQLEPFFLGVALPNFDARGEGRLVYSPSARAMGLQGKLDAGASRLEVINPVWRAIGPVKLQAQFDVSASGAVARLRQLNVRLSGEKEVLKLSASQAAEVDFSERRLRVGGVAPGEALTLELYGVPLAWVAPFVPNAAVSGGIITGLFSVEGGADRLMLRAVQPLHIDQLTVVQHGETLLSKAAINVAFDVVLTDKELQAKVSEFTLQTPMRDLVRAEARVAIPVSPSPPVSVQVSYAADLPSLLTPWLPRGHVKLSGKSDFTLTEGAVAIRSSSTTLTDATGAFLLKAATRHDFTFDLASSRVTGEQTPVDLMEFVSGRLPLAWLPISQLGAEISGTMEPGEFVLRVEGEKLSLRALAPIKLAGVALTQDGEPALTGLAIEASPWLEMSGGAAGVALTGDVSVRNAAGAVLLTCKAEAVRSVAEGLSATLAFNLEVPALSSQPLFAGAQSVSEGRASGEVRATINATRQVEARLTVNGLVASESGQILPVANLSFRAVVQPDGKISLRAPLLLDRAGERSDLDFSIDVTPVGRNYLVAGKLSSEQVELTDAIPLLSVFSPSAAHRGPTQVSKEDRETVAADQVSAWSRFSGQLLLDIKSVASGKEWSMTGLTGVVVIDPALIALQKLEASFGEKSRLKAKAAIQFAAGAQPYQLTGDFSLTEFDAGKLFKAFDPGKPPTVEGLFAVEGRFSGRGETLERAMEQTFGQFELTSRQGIFRGLQRTTGKVSMTSKAVELGATVLGSLFGSEKATKAAEKVAGQAYFVDQLAQSVGEFNYDQLSLRLVRDDTLNLSLEDISLISPEIRLLGKGSVTYVAGKPLLEQPLNVALSFAARGKIEQLLGKLHLVNGAKDDVGYARIREPITIGGTLAKPDPSAFFTRIATAKLNELLDGD